MGEAVPYLPLWKNRHCIWGTQISRRLAEMNTESLNREDVRRPVGLVRAVSIALFLTKATSSDRGKFGPRYHSMQNVIEHFDLQKPEMWIPWLWYRQRISTFRHSCFGARCGISTSEGRNLSSEMWVQTSIKPHHLSLKGQFRKICVPRN